MKSKISEILLAFIICCTYSCSDKPKSEKSGSGKIGKYVYIDEANILHTKTKCSAVYKDHNSQAVKPILTNDVTYDNLKQICSQCVTEKQLDQLFSSDNDEYRE